MGNIINIIIYLALGAFSGWLAGIIMKSEGGLIRNIILGVCGGVVGTLLFEIVGLGANSMIGGIIISVIGACLLVFLVNKFVK